ncbi:hypothetical protein AHAS_Ahas01G0313500 [Arachis hypogaea]
MFPSKPWTVASQQRNLREEDDAAVAFVLHGHAENEQAIADDVSESTNRKDATILCGSSIPRKAATLPLEILTVAVDSEENNPPQPLTAPKVGETKPKFRVTHDMDFNRDDTLLFNYLFSEGHSDEEILVRMLQYRLTRRHIQTLIPGRPIDGRVIEMVAMRNTCSIQHVRHPFFWCLPPAFAEGVAKGLSLEELTETYIPFWVKPSRFLNNMFQLGRIHDLMTSPVYAPLKVNTPNNLRVWPIRRGQGIPNCNTSDSSGAWVISCLDPKGCFNSLDISGVVNTNM